MTGFEGEQELRTRAEGASERKSWEDPQELFHAMQGKPPFLRLILLLLGTGN